MSDEQDNVRVSLGQQIEEVERELKARESVYARMYAKGTLQRSHGEFYVKRMEAVLRSLKWFKECEAELRAFMTHRHNEKQETRRITEELERERQERERAKEDQQ